MKNLITLLALLFIFSSCSAPAGQDEDTQETATATVSEAELPTLDGTWEMEYYRFYRNNEVTDTVEMNEGYRQVKMYSDGHVMWSRKQPMDSTQMFGYGTYMIDGNTFSENMEFGSHYMMGILDSMRIFNWVLEIGEDYYIQTEVNEEGNRVYSETYKRID